MDENNEEIIQVGDLNLFEPYKPQETKIDMAHLLITCFTDFCSERDLTDQEFEGARMFLKYLLNN